jgi:murein DD-endopeptidase MepM/ murein hydrolase activator NlpD
MNKKDYTNFFYHFYFIILTFLMLYMGQLIYKYDKKIESLNLEIEETYNHINSFYYLLNQIPLGSPLDSIEITSMYGWRWGRKHAGIDLNGTYKDSIHVTANGVVKRAGWLRGYGNCVMVDHLNGYTTLYAHLRKIYVKENQTVYKNQVIGMVGTTGFSTETHLHYEVKHLGNSKNPYYYIIFDNNLK